MFLERPPLPYRLIYHKAIWRFAPAGRKTVYLTFDDGPIPEHTPWVLDTLDRYNVKATFFMVGDNVLRYPELHKEVILRGHSVGNHTMHHTPGHRAGTADYLDEVERAAQLIGTSLFRPPHGVMRPKQMFRIASRYKIIMHDLLTRDYSRRLSAADVFSNVRRYVRNGSIIVFHDSIKAAPNMRPALPRSIEWLILQGYGFETIPMD